MLKSLKAKKLVTSFLPPILGGVFIGILISSDITYDKIIKPPLSPPAVIFPIVWTILYIMMGISLWLIRISDISQEEKRDKVRSFSAQLLLNFLWPIIFFKLETFIAAAICLALLLVLIIKTYIEFSKIDRRASLLLLPYIIWSIFALYLNIGVCILNIK